jgi:hypothetical protein
VGKRAKQTQLLSSQLGYAGLWKSSGYFDNRNMQIIPQSLSISINFIYCLLGFGTSVGQVSCFVSPLSLALGHCMLTFLKEDGTSGCWEQSGEGLDHP